MRRGEAKSSSGTGAPTAAHPSPDPEASKLAPGLYIVATPIGNLGDVTLRALAVLGAVAAIACEDTRVTAKLLARYDLRVPMLAYHDHNAERMRPRILARLGGGAAIALVSDAGTPLVSDPGYKLVQAAVAAGFPVVPLPGASALLAALMVAGLPTDRFLFAGFLPAKEGQRRQALAELSPVPATLVFYETGGRLGPALAAMAQVLGDRPAAVARELTKLHEEVARGTLAELAERYRAVAPRGEIAVVVGPPGAADAPAFDLDTALTDALATMRTAEAAAMVAAASGLPRRTVYARALALVKGSA
ncbi:MAG: 16S rRNA (cytidine(1402)-2'-O)-methyltransferase [Alphaproteobacteria bacterium]|nr:16S rRNA (cytidine(1402)-2'-O)-methyltransferase [Alphaproteobacteria bacterium]